MRDWRRWLSAVVLLAFFGAAVVYRDDVVAAGQEIRSLPAPWFFALALLGAALTVTGGLIGTALDPKLKLRHAVMSQQAALAANNTAVASGPVALGLRVAMLRSWGIDDARTGVIIFGAGIITSLRAWVAAGSIAAIALLSTTRQSIDEWLLWVVVVVAVIVLTSTAATLWWLLRSPEPLAWISVRLERFGNRVGRRFPYVHRTLQAIDLPSFCERFRGAAVHTAGRRGMWAVGGAFVELTAMLAVPVVVIRAFGIGAEILSATEIVAVFVLVKMLASITPIPGGIGVTELGLTATLTRFGAPEAPVLASVLTYRAITFLLPIAVGGLSLALWRRGLSSANSRDEPAQPPVAVVAAPAAPDATAA